ncbi:glutamate decarboxylase [Trichodelitschia bisporula]|uniref:Glutamate decarboxylase n=1 Tax=Trichodelitschia bisporula TaxID=703511 RepID=A0A6G1I949_9PEZI|nr:glutamate decarboxylase [Trichodelitschia bisporula]
MSLSRHIDPEELVEHLKDTAFSARGKTAGIGSTHISHSSSANPAEGLQLTKHVIPKETSPPEAVYDAIHYELELDSTPNLNLASFVATEMEPWARKLVVENLGKNMADADAYQMRKAMQDMHARCVSILANLWNVQKGEKAIGTATTGSSEAIHLGGLAMKRRWQEKRKAEGKDTLHPNIIMGANAQVALEKFARYFEVEPRILPVSAKSQYRLDPDLVKENLDENTIGIFVILGSTYTGHYEPVEEIHGILDEFEKKTGIYIPIHVDAASGGFIAPFTHAKAGFKWDFSLPRVHSINVSGHKYGLVYPGLGWIVWRDEQYLPKHLIFELSYLGGTEESYTLNFSRPGAQVIAQYYNLMRFGFKGYRDIAETTLSNARLLSDALEATGWFRCLSSIHRKKGDLEYRPGKKPFQGRSSADFNPGLPVVAFTLTDEFKKENPHVKQVTISKLLHAKRYCVPNYALPPKEQDTEIMRIVIRETMQLELLDRLIADICSVTETVMSTDTFDLSAWQPYSTKGKVGAEKKKEKELKNHGIHRSVC